jgi:hypothetical protein
MADIRLAWINVSLLTAAQLAALQPAVIAASPDIPDTAIAKIKAAYPGTNQETARATIRAMLASLYAIIEERVVDVRRATDEATVRAGEAEEREAMHVAWPPELV